jgi:predicted phosphodiesterase
LIVVIGDTHFPYHSKKTLSAFYRILKKLDGVKAVIQVGDLYDFYNLSRFPRNQNLDKPKEEIIKARKCGAEMWKKVQSLVPQAACYQLIGNHDERLKKAVMSKLPELYEVVDMSHLWEFDGVQTMRSQREELIIQDIVFLHGHYTHPGRHLTYNQQSTVLGHTHKGSCVFRRYRDEIMFELNAGCMADLDSVPLSYTMQKKHSTYMNGFAIIDELGPRFIPLMEGKTWNKI